MNSTIINILLWIAAILITLSAAVYQRTTGPSYPITGNYRVSGDVFEYTLDRTHGGKSDQEVSLSVPPRARGQLIWRHYPTDRPWNTQEMVIQDGMATGNIPNQPPAGKIEYYINISASNSKISIPGEGERAITRFKGKVPPGVLIPHIILMFLGMLISNRAGLDAAIRRTSPKILTFTSLLLLASGGLIFGCIVQYYAFGQAWTGFPFGHDLTDNKLAVAVIVWLIPAYKIMKKKDAKNWVLIAALVVFAIYIIPHSVLGSELKYD